MGEQREAAGQWQFGEPCPYCGKKGAKIICWKKNQWKELRGGKTVRNARVSWRAQCRNCGTAIRYVREADILERYGKEVVDACKIGVEFNI